MKNFIKRFAAVFLTMVMMVVFAACGNANNTKNNSNTENVQKKQTEASTTQYPYTVKDSRGKEIVIEKEPKRIVSISPTLTEIIYALGKGNELVGRTDYCDYPAEAKNVESIGNTMDLNIEKIIELKPDVVFISMVMEDKIKRLEDLGIKVFVIYEANDLNGAYASIKDIGKVINTEVEAEELVATMKKKIEDINEKVKNEKGPKIYYIVGFGKEGDYTATGDTFIGQIIDMAGGENIAKDAVGWKYSLEKIIENDPEYIFISKNYGMKEQFMATASYKELSAVKNNKVIEIDDNLISRQGPRLAEGVETLAKILHPNLFK